MNSTGDLDFATIHSRNGFIHIGRPRERRAADAHRTAAGAAHGAGRGRGLEKRRQGRFKLRHDTAGGWKKC